MDDRSSLKEVFVEDDRLNGYVQYTPVIAQAGADVSVISIRPAPEGGIFDALPALVTTVQIVEAGKVREQRGVVFTKVWTSDDIQRAGVSHREGERIFAPPHQAVSAVMDLHNVAGWLKAFRARAPDLGDEVEAWLVRAFVMGRIWRGAELEAVHGQGVKRRREVSQTNAKSAAKAGEQRAAMATEWYASAVGWVQGLIATRPDPAAPLTNVALMNLIRRDWANRPPLIRRQFPNDDVNSDAVGASLENWQRALVSKWEKDFGLRVPRKEKGTR